MSSKLVLDLEIKKDFNEVGGKQYFDRLGVSVCGVFNYATDEYRAYKEAELGELLEVLRETKAIIGFNQISFDMVVLKPYLNGLDVGRIKQIDIMEKLHQTLGYRVSLDSVAEATLGTKKSGHGADAVGLYKRGEWDKLIKYCLDDVKITREVYEFGLKNSYVKFKAGWGSYEVTVDFNS